MCEQITLPISLHFPSNRIDLNFLLDSMLLGKAKQII